MYIAYETRRVWEESKPGTETFQPLVVSALVEPEERARQSNQIEGPAHTSGQVFDIEYTSLSPKELESLRFILDDLGWEGYLGFVDDGPKNIHIGCAPMARDFFSFVFQEGLEKNAGVSKPNPETPQ